MASLLQCCRIAAANKKTRAFDRQERTFTGICATRPSPIIGGSRPRSTWRTAELSFERYRRVLAAFHGFYAPLEARFWRFGPVAPPLGFALPQRARLLELDLGALGAPATVARCEDLPEIATTAELAGCLYVLEGAALGGQVLARSLASRWQLTPSTGTAFFFGDGPVATKRRWALVLDWLERVALAGADAPAAVAAASATFLALERWAAVQGATR